MLRKNGTTVSHLVVLRVVQKITEALHAIYLTVIIDRVHTVLLVATMLEFGAQGRSGARIKRARQDAAVAVMITTIEVVRSVIHVATVPIRTVETYLAVLVIRTWIVIPGEYFVAIRVSFSLKSMQYVCDFSKLKTIQKRLEAHLTLPKLIRTQLQFFSYHYSDSSKTRLQFGFGDEYVEVLCFNATVPSDTAALSMVSNLRNS